MSLFNVFAVILAAARASALVPPSSSPHAYPGQPSGDYTPAWQSYFHVNNSQLKLSFEPPSSFAGNVRTARPGHDDDSLFFWAFEQSPGSLTSNTSTAPWLIWLNGGPGSSSMLGVLLENGPIHFDDFSDDQTPHLNQASWHQLADIIYIDQPVGTGYATADSNGYAVDEEDIATDFVGFLSNLVKVFPALATRPLIFTGESYSGRFIPYISRALLALNNPPVQLSRIAIGDGTLGSLILHHHAPMTTVIQTYPQLLDYNFTALQFYEQQSHLCGYDLNLTYPQTGGHFPSLVEIQPTAVGRMLSSFIAAKPGRGLLRPERATWGARRRSLQPERIHREVGSGFDPSTTIDPWYGCFLLDSVSDFAVNHSFPYANGIDVYDVPDGGHELPLNHGLSVFLNDPTIRAALHAPNKTWSPMTAFPFAGGEDDPSPEVTFFGDIIERLDKVVLYSGNDDMLDSHRGTEVVIQNTTWGGIQGFTKPPLTEWHADNTSTVSGVVHQERGLTYVLVKGAGHQIPLFAPTLALALLRDFILGDNPSGTVQTDGSVLGGENAALHPILRGQNGIRFFDGTSTTTTVWPQATRQAWNDAVQTGQPA